MSEAVFVAVPNRGTVATGTATALLQMGKHPAYCVRTKACSLLTLSFNALWADALNEREHFRYFVMLHDDIVPMEYGWLDTLMHEFHQSKADVLSCVVPIKDEDGLTSTAFMNPTTRHMVRLSMTEAMTMPKTFDAAAAGKPGWVVLPNTGLWVCDFHAPWIEKVCFTIRDKIFKDPHDGKWKAQCFSEDWDFGAQLAAWGLKVCATMAIKLTHKGGFDFPNFTAWGALKTDDQVNTWAPPARNYLG